MKQRCLNPNNKKFRHYGGANPPVVIASRWLGERGFENFLADLGKRPSPKHSLSRFLDMGNYEPGNVVWATHAEQGMERQLKNDAADPKRLQKRLNKIRRAYYRTRKNRRSLRRAA